ncbi:MAG: hypothetical protein ABW098_12290 [Candidatus Thiodiazotropha sp.]
MPTDGQGLIRLLRSLTPSGRHRKAQASCVAALLVERRVRIMTCRAAN